MDHSQTHYAQHNGDDHCYCVHTDWLHDRYRKFAELFRYVRVYFNLGMGHCFGSELSFYRMVDKFDAWICDPGNGDVVQYSGGLDARLHGPTYKGIVGCYHFPADI